jgi:hypothetical protein
VWEQPIGTFPVDFKRQGDQWMHHLAVELTGSKHIGATGTDGVSPVEIGPPMSGPVTSKLQVSPHEDGIVCVVVGEGELVSDAQVEPWRQAAQEATTALDRRNHDFVWEAIVGTHPSAPRPDLLGALGAPRALGPVNLMPGGVCMREYVTNRDYAVNGSSFGVCDSFPVIASGRVSTYDWDVVMPVAHYCLHRVCALLTLCPGRLWIPRSRPQQLVADQDSMKVPVVVGPVQQIPSRLLEPEWHGAIPLKTPMFELPEWIEPAWQALDADQELDTAINAYYEARRLEGEHPSIAFLTYVAAIEGFGIRFVPDAPCDCRPGCTHQKAVAHKRFRRALKTVMTNREVQQFEAHYDLRSSIGHTGSLFASEHIFGYPLLRLFQQTNDIIFDYAWRLPLRKACRDVLLKALQEACTGA